MSVTCWIELLLLLALAGCREQSKDDPQPDLSAVEPQHARELMGYEVDELSSIGAYLPDLDDGRLKVAPPIDWHTAPRSRDYVARFVFDRQSALPIITIHVREAEEDDPRDLARENVASYAATLAAGMDRERRDALKGPIEPLMLGDIPCARYVRAKAFRRGERIVRANCEVVETIHDGRIYTIELDAHTGTLVEFRADAYAVMANVKFPLAESADKDPEGVDH